MADGSRPIFHAPNGAVSYGNPDPSNVAARYVAKAMTRVHPRQREALLHALIDHAQDGLSVIAGRGQ
jgi:hypothetical protein